MCRYISFICFLIWSYHHQFSKFSATVSLYLSYILFSSLNSKHLHRLFKNTNWRIYLLIYERERDIDQLPSECALNGDWTPSLPVYGTMLQPMRDLARALKTLVSVSYTLACVLHSFKFSHFNSGNFHPIQHSIFISIKCLLFNLIF